MSLNHIAANDGSFNVVIGDKVYTFGKDHISYYALVECVVKGREERFVELLDGRKGIENFTNGDFSVINETLYYNGEECHKVISDRLMDMIRDGFDYDPMFNFLTRLYKNPSNRAVLELFNFMMHQGLPITEDGYILAYKGVKIHKGQPFFDVAGNPVQSGDYVDGWTGNTHRYNVGDVAEMPRRKVCDDFRRGCGPGLHAGSPDYSIGWAETPVIVKVDPADVVSIPSDCDCQKLRACRIEIISDYRYTFTKPVETGVEDEDLDDDDDFDLMEAMTCDDEDDEELYCYDCLADYDYECDCEDEDDDDEWLDDEDVYDPYWP